MNKLEETGDKKFIMSYSKLVPLAVGLVVFTNTVSLLIYNQQQNSDNIVYNVSAEKRRLKNAIKEQDYLHKIEHLEKELIDCND